MRVDLVETRVDLDREFFNTIHDRRGRFGTKGSLSGGGGRDFKSKRDVVEAQARKAIDSGSDAGVHAAGKKLLAMTPKVGDKITVKHNGSHHEATVRHVGDDLSVHAAYKHNGNTHHVKIPGLSKKVLVGLAAATLEKDWTKGMVEVRQFFNTRHDPHSGRFAPRAATEIGVTPNRGPARGSLDEVQPYFSTPRYKGFEKQAKTSAADHNVKVLKSERAAGFWEGSLEPSAQIKVSGKPSDVKAYATGLGKSFNQDGVISFTPQKGGTSRRYRFHVDDPNVGVAALKKAGVMGATVKGHTVEVLDLDGSGLGAITSLQGALGRGSVARGAGRLYFKGMDYSAIMMALCPTT